MSTGKLGFRTLLDSVGNPVLALRKNFQVMYCNPSYAEFVGLIPGELEGKNLLELFPEVVGSPSHLAYLHVLETGETREVNQKLGNRYLRENVYRTPWGIISIGEETTEYHRLAEFANASQAEGQAILESVHDAVIIYDAHTGDIMNANNQALKMFGYNREQMLRMNIRNLSSGQPPYTREDFWQVLKKAVYSQVQPLEWEARDRTGRLFWIEIGAKRALIGGEECLVSPVRDITGIKQLQAALRKSEERYRELVDNTSDMIYVHDLDGRFIFVNKAAERITGYWREELLKMNIEQLVAHDYLQLLQSMAYRRKSKLKGNTYELEIENRHGERVFLDISTWPVYRAGKPVAVQGIARDVTERKLAELASMQSQEDAQDIINHLPDATLVVNTEGKVVVWNKAMEELTGVKAEDMLGKGDYQYAVPFYGTTRPLLVDLVLRPDEVQKYYCVYHHENFVLIGETDATHLRGKGQYLWGTASPIYDSTGRLLGAVECLRDFTEQRRIREALYISERQLRQQIGLLKGVLDNLGYMVWTCDTAGKLTFINKKSEYELGCRREDLLDKNLLELVSAEQRPILQRELLDRLPQGAAGSWRFTIHLASGTAYPAQLNATPLLEEEQVLGAMLQLEPVTG